MAQKVDMRKAALKYAEFLWHVFPIVPRTKIPVTRQGFKDATTDAIVIAAWWDKYPDANIGLSCAASGIVALDGDPSRYDDDSRELVAMLMSEDYATAMQVTPTRGHHFIYTLPPDVVLTNSPGRLPPGIDVRANGYILLAPSTVLYREDDAVAKGVEDGFLGKYKWQPSPRDMPPQPLPDFVLELLKPKQPKQPERPATVYVPPINGNHAQTERYAAAALEKELDALARTPEGGRNEQLNKSAFSLGQLVAGGALDEGEVIDKLETVALAIGLKESEIPATIRSGLKGGAKDPRGVPKVPELIWPVTSDAPAEPQIEEEASTDEAEDAAPRNDDNPSLEPLWKLRTLRDAYQPRAPIQYLVDGLLPCPSLDIVYGGPGSLKSMLLADLSVCVAAGQPWLGAFPFGKPGITIAVTQAPVLWIDFDNGLRRTDERFDALGKARNLPETLPLHYVSMPTPWLDASNPQIVTQVAELIRTIGAKLVVIDNLGLITGGVEENSAGMARVMGNLRWLCEMTNSAVVVVHHQRKSGGADDKGIRKGELLRGHSSIEASLDLALVVERKEGEDSVAVIPTKVRGYREHDIIGAQFVFSHHEGTKDLATAQFYSTEVVRKETRDIVTVETVIKMILGRGGRMAQKQLVDAVRDTMAAEPGGSAPGVNRVRGILNNMVDEGDLVAQKHEKMYIYELS